MAKGKKLSASEFKRGFLNLLDEDLSKLDPADRLERATRAYAKAVRLCHGTDATKFLEKRHPHSDQQPLKDYLSCEELARRQLQELRRKQVKVIIMFAIAILVLLSLIFLVGPADAQVMPEKVKAAPVNFYSTAKPEHDHRWFRRLAITESFLTSADIGTSVVIFNRGGYEREIPMLTGKHPNPGIFALELYAGEAAWHYAAYRLEPKHPRLARIMQIGAIIDSAYSVGNNARVLANWKH